MGYVFDIIIIAIIAVTIFFSYKKGFIKTVLSALSFFIALIVAFSLQPKVSEIMIKLPMVDSIRESVREQFIKMSPSTTEDEYDPDALISKKPEGFTNLLKIVGIDQDDLNEKYEGWKKDTTKDAADLLVEYVADPLIKNAVNIIAFVAVFIVAIIVLKLITYILDKICKLPVLKQANKALGLVTGILLGVFRAYVFGALVTLFWDFILLNYPKITIDDSIIFKLFYDDANILLNFFK